MYERGSMTIYLDRIKDLYKEHWRHYAMNTITHEAIHFLQDMEVPPSNDSGFGLISLPLTADGRAEVDDIGYVGDVYWQEAEAHSNDDTLQNALDVLDLLREKIPNYYDY